MVCHPQFSAEQVEKVRVATGHHEPKSRCKERPASARVYVPKWNAGEVFIAIVVAVLAAAMVGAVVYLARDQEGLLGSIGMIVTWPVWWIEVALYWTVGALVAEGVARVRHRKRRRQLRDHLRGRFR